MAIHRSMREDQFVQFIAGELDVAAEDIVSWDVMCHDTNLSTIWGIEEEFISAPRLDNLASCFAGLRALIAAADDVTPECIPAITFFDHEEVGSSSVGGPGSITSGPLGIGTFTVRNSGAVGNNYIKSKNTDPRTISNAIVFYVLA